MTILTFCVLVVAAAALAGFVGALTGLGGGVVLVPALVLFFHVDIRYAIGASLVSVIATSSGAASAYVKEGFTNIRVGMLLEIATTLGAVLGATVAPHVGTRAIGMIFGLVLIYSALESLFQIGYAGMPSLKPDVMATGLKLNGSYPDGGRMQSYNVRNVPAGFLLMLVAGGLSGLLGIGSGALKVIAMDRAMKIPFKVSTTTSNFMIGVTAAASAGLYLKRGYIDPIVAMPVISGVLAGAFLGSKVLLRTKVSALRKLFAVVILIVAIEMLYNAGTGKLG